MYTLPTVTTLQQTLRQASRLLAAPVRAGQMAALLGAVLLASTTLSTQADALNTKPMITTATLNPSPINEGGTATLALAFTDPDAADHHHVTVKWDIVWEQKQEEFYLPAGQRTFQTTHKFPDGVRFENGSFHPVKVWIFVEDDQPDPDLEDGTFSDFREVELTVNNVAPAIVGASVQVTKGSPNSGTLTVAGQFTEPGTDTVSVLVNWGHTTPGTAKQGEACAVNQHAKQFTCQHAYPANLAGTYTVTLTARDEDGGTSTMTRSIQMP